MKYFSREEADKIIDKSDTILCSDSINNPNKEAASVLYEVVKSDPDPFFSAIAAFNLGLATGIRTERQRRRRKRSTP